MADLEPDPPPSVSMGRRVFGGAAWITLAAGSGRMLSFATAPILTALISPAGYGVAALVFSVSSLTATLALAGADGSYGRHWAGGRGVGSAATERFFWRFTAASALAWTLAAAAFWIFAAGVRRDAPSSLAILLVVLVPVWVAAAMARVRVRFRKQYGRLAVALLAAAATTAASSVFLAATWRPDEWALVGGTACGMIAELAILGVPLRSALRGSAVSGWRHRAKLLEIGLAGLASGCMYWVITSSDRWFILWFRDAGELGTYTFASSIGMVGLMVNTAILTAWVPEVTTAHDDANEEAAETGRNWAKVAAFLLLVWLAVSSSGGDLIRLLADERFHDGTRYVPWMAAGVLFYGVASLGNTGLWLAKDLKPSAYWWVGGAVTSIGLNALWVPILGAQGAAVTVCVSLALIACGVLWSAHRSFPLRIPWGTLLPVAVGILAVGVPMIPAWHDRPIVSLALKLPVGAGVFLLVTRFLAPDWTRNALRKVLAVGEEGQRRLR